MMEFMTDFGMLGIGLGLFAIAGMIVNVLDRLNHKGASR